MIGRLPPVGQRIRYRRGAAAPAMDAYVTHWLNSGTAALAVALCAALAARPGRKQVLLPAYACPDLVAAAVYAGATPVLVDCAGDDPGFELSALAKACTADVAALVAVNFLGIGERLPELASLAAGVGALLVEDCAQWYPEHAAAVPVAARIVSFGRGKPVNLLGGGALLLPRDGELVGRVPVVDSPMHALGRAKALAFNALLHPAAYACISALPGINLGETRYHPLVDVQQMDDARLGLMAANTDAWLGRSRWREQRIAQLLDGVASLRLLPEVLASRSGRLLRYPLLCRDRAQRDAMLHALRNLGASAFYAAPLALVAGVVPLLPRLSQTPGAAEFADRLLTLPLHDGVGEAHLQQMASTIRQFG
jgi:dTDP-4-amino-4,6-dideoxygalactose transaminase